MSVSAAPFRLNVVFCKHSRSPSMRDRLRRETWKKWTFYVGNHVEPEPEPGGFEQA